MSEQHAPVPDDFRTWLTELGADAYALAWVAGESSPTGGVGADAPTMGKTGIARPGADLTRITVQEVTRGRLDTLRRWLQLDDGRRHLAIIGADIDGLREYTPGELTAQLMHARIADEAEIAALLASWLYRRNAEAPQRQELGWVTAAAAWCYHMGAFASHPPLSVLSSALARAGERDEATKELVLSTGWKMADLLELLERPLRPRAELAEDWRTMKSLALEVPVLQPSADWLLDQIALRDAHAQQLRAVLEPDITDYERDRRTDEDRLGAAPTLDEARTAHLAQARETVRAYTAASYSGREQEAQQILDAFPIPERSLEPSGPATAWRQNSATAQDAVKALAAQRAATTAEDGTDYYADPELLHAENSYLAAREGQLHLIHDALGRLASPSPTPRDLPDELAEVAAAQTQRRVIEAFGTLDRAAQALDGQIDYLRKQPVPAHRRTTTAAELDLLTTVRSGLDQVATSSTPLDGGAIASRVKQIMHTPQPEPSWRPPSPRERDRRIEEQSAVMPDPGTPGIRP
jgi:hypothetical protein